MTHTFSSLVTSPEPNTVYGRRVITGPVDKWRMLGTSTVLTSPGVHPSTPSPAFHPVLYAWGRGLARRASFPKALAQHESKLFLTSGNCEVHRDKML